LRAAAEGNRRRSCHESAAPHDDVSVLQRSQESVGIVGQRVAQRKQDNSSISVTFVSVAVLSFYSGFEFSKLALVHVHIPQHLSSILP